MTQKALGNRLFSDLIQDWLALAKAKVKPSSYAQYVKRVEKNILPYFEGARLRDITPDSVLGFVQHLQSEGYNEKYIYDLTTLLKSVLKSITRTYGYPDPTVGMEGILTGREHADIPREPAYGEELCERLIEVLNTDPDLTKCGILMTLYTGLRIGELCALKWEDIDLDGGTLAIRRTIQRVSTENGSVLMTTELGRQAKKYRKEYNAELSEYGEIRKQVLEFYPSGHIPKVENLEKRISSLESDLSAKNAEFRQADKKARELANAQQTIEEYLRQEQSQDHRKKKRNDLE